MTVSTITSTMQDDYQLTLRPLFEFGRRAHANSKIITYTGATDGPAYVESTFAEVADRTDAEALRGDWGVIDAEDVAAGIRTVVDVRWHDA